MRRCRNNLNSNSINDIWYEFGDTGNSNLTTGIPYRGRSIIIRDEGQINPMVEKLRDIKGGRGYDPNTIDRLTSRIITIKQIRNDF